MYVYSRYEVRLIRHQSLTHVAINYIRMTDLDTNHTHSVLHLNFTTWPDHGAPTDTLPILRVSLRNLLKVKISSLI